MIKYPNFLILPSDRSIDQCVELHKKLSGFGFYNLKNSSLHNVSCPESESSDGSLTNGIDQVDITHIRNADVVITIMPGNDSMYKHIEFAIHDDKNVYIIGKEIDIKYYGSRYSSLSEYDNVFILDDLNKSYGIIHKHLSEIQNARKDIKLEQHNNRMQ